MVGNSLNLVDYIKGYLSGDFKNGVASFLGESKDKTQSGINAAVPGVLLGLDRAASEPEGVRRLATAVDNADDRILSNLDGMFGPSSFGDMGSTALQSILGVGGLSELTGNLGRTSGLSGKAVTTLLGFLAPVVFGALKRLKLSRGLDAAGLSSLLSSQRSNIEAAMPDAMREFTEETYRAPLPVSNIRTTEAHPNVERERRKSSFGWILPLAILAGLLGLLWYWPSRPSVRAGREESGLTEQSSRVRDQMRLEHGAAFDILKNKYQSVIREAQDQGVQISSITSQDGKLLIQGTAPSAEAAAKVWDQIKRVNPNMDDIVADFKVDSSLAASTSSKAETEGYNTESGSTEATSPEGALPRAKPTAPPESSTESGTHTYIVKAGDTLSSISKEFYGNSEDYVRIFNANKDQLNNPNSLEVGQSLEIPMK
jgi:LysM repeat protein